MDTRSTVASFPFGEREWRLDPGADFSDLSRMESYYVEMARQLCPERYEKEGKIEALLRLSAYLKKVKRLLFELKRPWYEKSLEFQMACMHLMLSGDVSDKERECMIRMLSERAVFIHKMEEQKELICWEIYRCRRQIGDVEWLLRRLGFRRLSSGELIRAGDEESDRDEVSSPEEGEDWEGSEDDSEA